MDHRLQLLLQREEIVQLTQLVKRVTSATVGLWGNLWPLSMTTRNGDLADRRPELQIRLHPCNIRDSEGARLEYCGIDTWHAGL